MALIGACWFLGDHMQGCLSACGRGLRSTRVTTPTSLEIRHSDTHCTVVYLSQQVDRNRHIMLCTSHIHDLL